MTCICGQGWHTHCCKCGALLPAGWDDYVCETCLDKTIKRNMKALMLHGDPHAPLDES